MRVIVTGCAGFIGSHLAESLLEEGHEVLGVDSLLDNYGRTEKLRNLSFARAWDSFSWIELDLAQDDLDQLQEGFDVLFHLAAEPGVRPSWGARFTSYVRNNVLATHRLIAAASSVARIVYASSSSVYGEAERLPTDENATPLPISPYGVTKLAAEHLCRSCHPSSEFQCVSLRYFSVFGPRQRPDMAFHRFCRAALEGSAVTLYGSGEQTRDFTYVKDVVDATKSAATMPLEGSKVYNVGAGCSVSLLDALGVIGEVSGRELEVRRAPHAHGDVRDTGADISLARRELGFAPKTSLAEGLRAEFEWLSETLARRSGTPRSG